MGSQSWGLPASWPWEPGNSKLPGRKESTHPLWNICKVLVLLAHNSRGLHTMLGSSAQQCKMTHPAQTKRTHHSIVRYHCVAGGGCTKGMRVDVSLLYFSQTVLILALFRGIVCRLGLWNSEQSLTVSRQETGSQTPVSPCCGLHFFLCSFDSEPTWTSSHPFLLKKTVWQIPPLSGERLCATIKELFSWHYDSLASGPVKILL